MSIPIVDHIQDDTTHNVASLASSSLQGKNDGPFVLRQDNNHTRTVKRNPVPISINKDFSKSNIKAASLSKKRRLPNTTFDHCGLIFFLHIPKTGGSTIRLNLQERDDITYHFAPGLGLYDEAIKQVRRYVSTETKRKRNVVILEVHGRDAPHLLQLQKTLLKLRRNAANSNIPTFFFTVMRQPITYALSYFNFFHVQYGANKYFPQVEPTESNLVKYALHNPQCQFMARGEFSLRNMTHKQIPSVEECSKVYNVLIETMDWVGTTERLNADVLPVLKRILGLKSDFAFQRYTVSKKLTNESISYPQLSQSTIDTIQSMSQLDAELYGKLSREFHVV